MVATTVLLMVGIVTAVVLVGIALLGRSRAAHAGRGSSADANWTPAIFGDGGSGDCSAGDAGCDGGGGGGGN